LRPLIDRYGVAQKPACPREPLTFAEVISSKRDVRVPWLPLIIKASFALMMAKPDSTFQQIASTSGNTGVVNGKRSFESSVELSIDESTSRSLYTWCIAKNS
jgi:hypothetical protein